MKTEIRPYRSNSDVEYALAVLKRGGVVVFPTETVYGLGALMSNEEAVRKIYEIKGRDNNKPISVLVAQAEHAKMAAQIEDKKTFQKIADAFWPGPLTLVIPKNPEVADSVTAGKQTIGVRIPDHPFALALADAAQEPIAATSANLSGEPAALSAEEAVRALDGKVDLIIDGGPCKVKVASTVAALLGTQVQIYREGLISEEDLKNVIEKY